MFKLLAAKYVRKWLFTYKQPYVNKMLFYDHYRCVSNDNIY